LVWWSTPTTFAIVRFGASGCSALIARPSSSALLEAELSPILQVLGDRAGLQNS
jgi:hypothetical protein